MNRITESGAHIMVGHLVRSFVDATPAEESEQEWTARALRLQASLGKVLGVMPSHWSIEELVTTFEELESVDAGTHPELVTDMSGVTDNTDLVRDYLLGRVVRETTELLTSAGFGKQAVA